MDLRQGSPGSADGIKGPGPVIIGGRKAVGDGFAQAVRVELATIGQGERAERQGYATSHLTVRQPHQFETGPAEIAHNPVCVWNACQDSKGGVAGLFLAGQDADAQAGFGRDPVAEVRTVRCLAHGGGGGDKGMGRPDPLDHGGEPFERRQGLGRALDGQSAGRSEVPAQSGEDLFVEYGPDGAAFQPVKHQAHRVGADVDGGDVAGRADRRKQRFGHQRFFRDGS